MIDRAMHDEHPQRQFDESKDEPPPWWRTSPTDLAGVLAEIVAETADEHQPEIDLFWILFEYYNYLIDLREPLFAAACGEAVVDFFRDSDNKRFEAMFLELVARTRLEAGELAVGLAAFERMAEIHVPDGQEAEVSALAQDVWSYAGSGRFSMDVQPVLLASVSRVFRKLGESGPLAQVFLEAAELYSASGASAAAERAMEDAFSVTRDAQLEEFEAILYAQAAAFAFEQQDAQASVEAGEAAIAAYERMGRSVPRGVQVNLATAYSQLGEFRQAVDIYETALGGANDGERGQILLNLALAYRRLGDLSAATRSADEARSLLARSTEREHHLGHRQVRGALACGLA